MIYIAGQGSSDGTERGGVTLVDHDTHLPVGYSEPIDEMLYLAVDPSGQFLYGVAGVQHGLVYAWRIVADGLVQLGCPVSSGGSEPCHLLVHPDGYLVVANYGNAEAGSIATLLIGEDGSLGRATVLVRDSVPGPDPDRQRESHIHQVVPGRDGEILVVDLGADEITSYLLEYGGLVDPVVSRAPSGSGPRHLVLLDNGDIAVSGELSSTFLRARRAGRNFVDWVTTPSTGLAPPVGVVNYPSDLRGSPNPDVLYLANRGIDSVAALSISDGTVVAEGLCGVAPRQLVVHDGLVYVAATDSNEVNVLDGSTLQPTRQPLAIGRPMCVVIPSTAAPGKQA